MISFKVDVRFALDLKDDFVMNETLDLYQFIGKDPIKAFYLGLNIQDWFKELDKKQQYLYSKQARHNKDDLEKYQSQIEFWTKKFSKDDSELDMVELSEYILNNMFWNEDTEELDRVKMAFFFGNIISNQQSSNTILQLDVDDNIIKEWNENDNFEGFDKKAIIKCCNGEQKSHGGFRWKFKE